MAQVIAICNRKGGTGKTTTAINLAAALAMGGKFILLVDLDPQANASSGLGLDYQTIEAGTYEVLIGKVPVSRAVQATGIDGLRVLPASANLAGAEVELVSMFSREWKLKEALAEVQGAYDFILIDCPPSLGLLTINGLVAADRVLIPVQAEYYALEGLGQLLDTINLIKSNLKQDLEILGAVLTMFDSRNKLSGEVLGELQNHFPNRIFGTIIPRSVRLAEAPSFGKSIMQFDPSSRGAEAYKALAEEVTSSFGN